MPFGEILDLPLKIGKVTNPDAYYTSLPGSALVMKVFDKTNNLVARGMGMQFNENYQSFDVMEWGQRYCLEIVMGAMPPGQLTINSMFYMRLNDTMPTYKNLVSRRELSALVQIADHEDASLKGMVIDVFQGIAIVGQQGNWNSTSLYLRNASMKFRKRLTGLEWLALNPSLNYPATSGGVQSSTDVGLSS